jgi:acetyl-CoA acetyltransferase family protein
MSLEKCFIPFGAYWSTPFCRWQGSLAPFHSVKLAAQVANDVLGEKKIDPKRFDAVLLGLTVPQQSSFYGAPWLAGMIGAPDLTGPTLSQACATSARVIATAAAEVEIGQRECVLGVTCDRTSNGPHIYYPNPAGPGAKGDAEDWVWDAFNHDPFAKNAMIETAERVAKEAGITREEQDQVTLVRYQQYADSLAHERAFQKRYMVPVRLLRGKKEIGRVEGDEGVHPTTAEALAKLKPVVEGGSVTFGAQTHPADGNAGMVITTEARAKELSRDPAVRVQLLGFADARVERGMMPKAVVPAARRVLERSGVALSDVKAVKTHNPFAVNDVLLARELGLGQERINRYGSPLVYGHPQGPTGMRVVMELIEELAESGGGIGLFSGCAAGDTAMALVVRVG